MHIYKGDRLNFSIATLENLPQIVAIYNSTIPSRMVTADTSPIEIESRIGWFEDHLPDKWPLWVVNSNQKLIGWLGFEPFYDRPAYNNTAEISIYLAEEYRGKQLGIQILNFAFDQGKILGFTSLLGFIFEHNNPSLQLFTKAGFEEWAFLPQIALLDGYRKGLKILGKHI